MRTAEMRCHPNFGIRMLLVACGFWGALFFCGCASRTDRVRSLQAAYFAGDLSSANSSATQLLEKRKPDTNVVRLDQAMIDLASGNAAQAEQTLRAVRDELDYLTQASAAEEVVSLATDDTRRAYAGEDYERLLIRIFLAVANLLHDGRDAEAYVLQAVQLQEELLRSNGESVPDFKRLAFGPWMRAALLEEKHNRYDDVRRARIQVANWQSDFRDARVDLARAESGRHSQPGHGVLYVIALTGRGPYKEEVAERPTSAALLIADRILSATSEHSLPPTVAPVKVAAVRRSPSGPRAISVAVNGRPAGSTSTITDIGQLAVQQYEAIFPQVVARAVVRRVLKKAAVYAFKEQTGIGSDPLLDAAVNLGGIAWEATEHADTRCWHLLPDRIQVLRLELPAARHAIQLVPQTALPATPTNASVTIQDGMNTYLLGIFPDNNAIGQVLVH